MCLNVSGNVED